MQISITNTITIRLDEQELVLTKFEAEKLYQELGVSLGKNITSTHNTLFRGVTGPSDFSLHNNLTENKP